MNKIFEELKQVYILSDPDKISEEELINDMRSKKNVTLFLAVSALALTILNIFKQYWFMAVTTSVLALVFAFCSILSRDIRNRKIVSIMCIISIGAIFTYYAISGQNDGFAILWTILVPPVGSLLVGLRGGFILSIYFEILFLFMFYTPFSAHMLTHYNPTFVMRYPLLYFVSFASSLFLVVRKDMYKRQAEKMAHLDVLTGLYNRRYFEESIRKIEKEGKLNITTIFMIDVNRLKYTNDNFGHSAGDALLISVANYLKETFASDDIVCRLGGDEFSIITTHDKEAVDNYKKLLDKYVFEYEGRIIPEPSLSAGIVAVSDYPNCTIEEIERFADDSMYHAKEQYYRNSGVDRRLG